MDGEGVGQNHPNEMKHFCDSVTERGLGVTEYDGVFFPLLLLLLSQIWVGWLVGWLRMR